MRITVQAKNIDKNKSLSQSVKLGLNAPFALNAVNSVTPISWVTELRADIQSKTFIELDPGEFDPVIRVRHLLNDHLAGDYGMVPFDSITAYISECFSMTFRTTALLSDVFRFFLGSSERDAKTAAQVPLKNARELKDYVISKQTFITSNASRFDSYGSLAKNMIIDLVQDWMTAYIMDIVGLFKWRSKAVMTTVQLSPVHEIPSYDDLIAVLEAHELAEELKRYTSYDTRYLLDTFITGDNSAKRRISYNILAHATATQIADRVQNYRRTVDCEAVLDSLFYILRTSFYKDLVLLGKNIGSDVLNHDIYASLSQNYSMFWIHQECVRKGLDGYSLNHSRDILVEDVLKVFMNALSQVSPYKISPLSDRIGHFSKSSMLNHEGKPTMISIAEHVRGSNEVGAFSVFKLEDMRLLSVEPGLGEQFATILQSCSDVMNYDNLRKREKMLHEQIPLSKRLKATGAQINIDLLTLVDGAVQRNLDWASIKEYIDPNSSIEVQTRAVAKATYGLAIDMQKSEISDPEVDSAVAFLGKMVDKNFMELSKPADFGEMVSHTLVSRVFKILEKLKDLVMYKLMTLAIKASDEVHLVAHSSYDKDDPKGSILGLQFVNRTAQVTQLSYSAVYEGLIKTTEPLEALLYCRDFDNSTELTYHSPALPNEDQAYRNDNKWPWFAFSKGVRFTSKFENEFRGKTYSIDLDERFLLNRTRRLKFIRRTDNVFVRSMILSWLDTVSQIALDKHKEAQSAMKKGSSADVIVAQSNVVDILKYVARFINSLATTPMARAYIQRVMIAMRDQMHAYDQADDATDLDKLHFQLTLRSAATNTVLSYVFGEEVLTPLTKLASLYEEYKIMQMMLSDEMDRIEA